MNSSTGNPTLSLEQHPLLLKKIRSFLIPGVGFLLFALTLLELFAGKNDFLTDPATARHLRVGQLIFEKGELAEVDPLSYYQPALPWIDHQWLFELGLAGGERLGGLPLIYAGGFALFALIPFLLWRVLISQKILWPVALIEVLAVMVFFRVHLLLRPQLFNYILLLLVLGAWYRHPRGLSFLGGAFFFFLFAFWANVHGGFTAALLFLATALVGRMMDLKQKKRPCWGPWTQPWVLLGGAAALATWINPYGLRLHALIFHMVFGIESYSYWDEYKPPSLLSGEPMSLALILVGSALVLGRLLPGRARWRWESILPVFVFFLFALSTQRHVLLWMLVAAVPLGRDWSGFLRQKLPSLLQERCEIFSHIERGNRSHYWLIPLTVGLSLWFFPSTQAAKNLRIGARNLSPEAVTFLKTHSESFRRPLTTTWNGGPLVYHLAPHFQVSYDDRNEHYGDARILPYVAMLFCRSGWKETLAQGKHDSAILEPYWPLTAALRWDNKWQIVYEDKQSVLFLYTPAQSSLP